MLEFKKDPLVIASFTVLALGLIALLGLGKITWPQFFAGLGVLAAPSVIARKKKEWPGPPPSVVLIFVGAAAIAACASNTAQDKAREAEESYAAAHAKCAATEKSREAVDACRAKVREEWGVPPRKDAGP